MELPWNDLDFKAAWEEWLEYRRERRLPKYVPKGLQKTLANLVNISSNSSITAVKIIEQSMENNWAGLFKLKHNHGTHIQPPAGSAKKPGTSEARIRAAKDW